MIARLRPRWFFTLGPFVAVLGACTFLVDFDDRDPDAGADLDGGVDEGGPVTPQPEGSVPPSDTGPTNPCATKKNHERWGPKLTDRCCRGIARSFDSWSDDQDCNVCGFSCAPGQRCAQSIQGTFFCIGCGNDNALCNNTTQCCANTRTGPTVFANPTDQNAGVCTASDCAGNCGDRCPPPTQCKTDTVTSFYCAYVN